MAHEPEIMINGMQLSRKQTVALRVALLTFASLCAGDDLANLKIDPEYRGATDEILQLILAEMS